MSLVVRLRRVWVSTVGMALVALGSLVSANHVGAASAEPLSAIAQLKGIQERLKQDKSRGDWSAFLADAAQLRDFVHGSPSANLEVARAQLNLGMGADAALTLKRFFAMGATHPILASPLFRDAVAALGDDTAATSRPARDSTETQQIADTALLPEDIDHDARRHLFFVTSVRRGEVVSVDVHGNTRPFAQSPDHWPMLALKIDATRRRLWATEAALDGFTSVPQPDWGRSAILEYDLDSAQLLRRIEGPPHGALGDMTLLRNGDAIVADGQGGGVYRVVGDQLQRLDHGEFVSPQTPASCGDDRLLFIPDYVRGIASLDLRTGDVQWLDNSGRFALDETDGLYCVGNTLLAVQNGGTHPRVVAYRIEGHTVVDERVIDRRADGDFTHGVVIGTRFFYLSATGWLGLDDNGQAKPDVAPTRPRLMSARLR